MEFLPGIDFLTHPDPDGGPGVDFAQLRKERPFYFAVLRAGRAKMVYNAAGVPVMEFIKNRAYDGYVSQLKKLRIPWITVFAAYPWEWGNEQAEVYWQIIRNDLPVMPYVSLERFADAEWLPSMTGSRIDFYNTITGRLNALTGGRYKPGAEVGLYTNLSMLRSYLLPLPDEFRRNVSNFTAQWTSSDCPAVEGFDRWDLWQRYAGEVYFNGDAAAFSAWAKYDLQPLPGPEPEPEPEPQLSFWQKIIRWLMDLLGRLLR